MEDNCKDSIIKKNKPNLLLSFYSITEKQEESSINSPINDVQFDKQINTDNDNNKNYLNNEFQKKEMNNNNLKDKELNKRKSSKTFNNYIKENESNNNNEKEKYKKLIRKEIKLDNMNKRISVQHNLNNHFLKQIKNNKQLILKQKSVNFNSFSNKRKKTLSILNYNSFNINKLFDKTLAKSKNLNLSSSNNSFIHSNNKKSNIKKRKINFNDNDDKILQIDLFETLKYSPMFEKSESIIHKERIYYGTLLLFTILSIIFQVSDSLLYIKRSKEYLEEENNMTISYLNELHYYSILKNRKISKQENYLRVFNIISSILCGILSINIYNIKYKFIKQTNKNNKNFYGKYNNYFGHNRKKKSLKDDGHISIIPNNDIILKDKLPKSEIIKAITSCIMNLICCPPSFNEVLIINKKDIILVYSLNNFFLIFSMIKFINIYRAIFHLSPLNKLIYKTICNSKMVKMDFKFMIRYFLNRYPITFIIINFFIFGTIFCILIYSIEYFSLDIKNGNWNNKGNNNNLNKFYNSIYLYLFYITKNEFGDIKPKSDLAVFIMIIGGSLGLFVTSYFVYYILQFINLSPEEQKAYKKLNKILNPLNKEHKSANLIKYFILVKKLFKDNKNIEKNYEINKLQLKTNKSEKRTYNRRKFNYALDNSGIDNIVDLIEENNKYKKKFINYLFQKFIIKIKLISECNIFKNDLLIARNFSHSFTNLLNTLKYKMNDNLNQLNNKLYIIINKERKYKDFIKFQKSNLKNIQNIIIYQNTLLNYLINKHNDNYEDYISLKSKMGKSIGYYSGKFLSSNKKLIKNNLKYFANSKRPKKNRLKKVRSSIIGANELSKFAKLKEIVHRKSYEYNNLYISKRKFKKIKSSDNLVLNGKNIIKKNFRIEFINIKKNKNRKSSYIFNKNEILDKIRFNIEK